MQIFPPAYIVPKLGKPMNTTTHFLEQLTTIIPLTDAEKSTLQHHLQVIRFSKNSYLLQQGDVSDTLYFIVSGLVRAYYDDLTNRDEVTSWFLPEGGFIYSVTSFVNNTPSFEAIVAEEDTVVVAISKQQLATLFSYSSTFSNIAFQLSQQYLCVYDERVRSLRLPAKERYKRFQSQYPTLEARVKLNHLASYLGIGRSTLCQLRSERN